MGPTYTKNDLLFTRNATLSGQHGLLCGKSSPAALGPRPTPSPPVPGPPRRRLRPDRPRPRLSQLQHLPVCWIPPSARPCPQASGQGGRCCRHFLCSQPPPAPTAPPTPCLRPEACELWTEAGCSPWSSPALPCEWEGRPGRGGPSQPSCPWAAPSAAAGLIRAVVTCESGHRRV